MRPAQKAQAAPSGGKGDPRAASVTMDRVISPEEQQKRERALKRWRELDTEYTTSWEPTHQDIIDFVQPNHGQFLTTDTNKGTRKDGSVINNHPADKARKLSAAIAVAVCSPAREWFVVSAQKRDHAEDPDVRAFCHDFQEAMFAGLSKIGWYAPNRNAIDDAVGPATGLCLIEEDDDNVARCTHVPVGHYRVGADSSGEVNVVVRRFTYTAAQMAEEFGPENCSIAVRFALRNQLTQTTKFTVLQLIEERADIEREHGKVDAPNMAWSSTWLEIGQGYTGSIVPGQSDASLPNGPKGILRESGYHEQPFYVFRWNQIGQNAYGSDSPGWNGLGDAKQLQDLELGSATMLALLMKPPMNRPDSLANASLLPGADNPVPSDQSAHAKFEPSYVIDPKSVSEARAEKREVEARITNAFYGDVLFMLSENQQAQPRTAEEIRGVKEERLLQLGSVFDRISMQLKIALRRVASLLHRAGMLPEPPAVLAQGEGGLQIDFVNPLVTAQKAIGYQGIQQLISLEISLGEAKKAQGSGKLDPDEIMDTALDMLGVKPDVLYSADEMAQQRAQAQARQNAMQQQQAMPEAAGAIKDLSNSDPEKLSQMLSRFGPAAQAQGTTPGA